jgi:aminoglycoside 6'-N-acetyltransferase I
MTIAPVNATQKEQWIRMATDLWPFLRREELIVVFDEWLPAKRICLVAYLYPGNPLAFINISLRHDYVEGTSSSPVGYIEGIYVEN